MNEEDFMNDVELLCQEYINEQNVDKEKLADKLQTVKIRLMWKSDYM